jgi:diguanylate cyclase (GGDEF)-like protein/PAS domain S-box-containing protein
MTVAFYGDVRPSRGGSQERFVLLADPSVRSSLQFGACMITNLSKDLDPSSDAPDAEPGVGGPQSADTKELTTLRARVLVLEETACFFDALLAMTDLGVVSCDRNGDRVVRNPALRALAGLPTAATETSVSVHAGARPDALAWLFDLADVEVTGDQRPLKRSQLGQDVEDIELRIGVDAAERRQIVTRSVTVFNAEGTPIGAIATTRDVTEERAAQRQAVESAVFFQDVLAASPDSTYVADVRKAAVTFGSRPENALGRGMDEILTMTSADVLELVHPDDRARVMAANVAVGALPHGEVLQIRARGLHSDGRWVWMSQRLTPFRRDAAGVVTHVLGVSRDISDMVEGEDRLLEMELRDPLTGLANRALLLDRVTGALERTAADRSEIVVMTCNLDGFKRINDDAGRAIGDAVLITIASRLVDAVGSSGLVARVDGDEFVILIASAASPVSGGRSGLTAHRAVTLSLASQLTDAVRTPIRIAGVNHRVTASVGVTYAQSWLPAPGAEPSVPTAASNASAVLQDADAAMYRAKALGRDRVEVFQASLRADILERGRVERVLRQALEGGPYLAPAPPAPAAGTLPSTPATPQRHPGAHAALTSAFQPVVEAGTLELVGFEALARLRDAAGGAIGPDSFIGVAEDTGLIRPLGVQILQAACRQLTQWRASHAGAQALTMAVNVSPLQAQHATLSRDIHTALQASGLQPQDLVMELTETALLHADPATLAMLRELRDDGVGVAIDDFGTGYASLRYLTEMPVTSVKVDRSFTQGLPHDRTCHTIVYAVARLAADLGLSCVVEGVETQDQLEALPAGVHVQGWLTGRPAAAEHLDLDQLLGAPRSAVS